MLKKALLWSIVGLLVVTIAVYAIQVDGYCYLENQSNHAGTKVLFMSDSPTAVTDSTYTDNTGYFSIDLEVGIYDLFYTHEGYFGEEILDQLFVAPTTLMDVTLMEGIPGVHISGSLSGVLEDTVYIVDGDIRVEEGDALTIEPGAIFYFMGDESTTYDFWVYGSINAVGTETDTIKFLPAPGVPGWGGLWVIYEGIHLEYCLITGGTYWALRATNCGHPDEMVISHCTITGNSPSSSGALIISNGSATVSHCTIAENQSNGVKVHYNTGAVTISDCVISGNTGYGIWADNPDDVTISNCTVTGNSNRGIFFEDQMLSDIAFIDHCVISNNYYGIYLFDINNVDITNCSVIGSYTDGISLYDSEANIVNTIVEGCYFWGMNFSNSPNVSVSHCDFFNNSSGNFFGNGPPYFGELFTINTNGDSCDVYANIFLDPLLVDPEIGIYNLQPSSPCIDAGDPNSPFDPDSTIADMGAFYYDQSSWVFPKDGISHPTEFRLLQNYPNPFNPNTTITYVLPTTTQVSLRIYNVSGQYVTTLVESWHQPGIYNISFDGSNYASGIYFCQMDAGDYCKTRKLLLVK